MPMKSVLDCDMVDLRMFWGDVATSSGTGFGKLTRVTSGVNLPPLEVIMSRHECHRRGNEVHQPQWSWAQECVHCFDIPPMKGGPVCPGLLLRLPAQRGRVSPMSARCSRPGSTFIGRLC